MREIKFRAWDGFRMSEIFGLGVMPKAFYRNEAPDLVFMQFTGLLDKNGKEIYEGDIVEWSIFTDAQDLAQGENEEKRIRDVVAFGSGCWKVEKRCEILGLKEPYRKLEIIGNIYENPDLLEG